MSRRPVFYSNKNERKNIADLSPRFVGKKQQGMHSGVVAQASAQMKRRKPDAKMVRLESPVYSRPKAELKKINQQKQLLSEQQIRNSALYKMLEQEIKQLARRQQQQIQNLLKIREDKKKEAETVKKQQFATKLQIWQLKNEVFDIKQLIQEQKSQTDRLLEQIQPLHNRNNDNNAVQNQEQNERAANNHVHNNNQLTQSNQQV